MRLMPPLALLLTLSVSLAAHAWILFVPTLDLAGAQTKMEESPTPMLAAKLVTPVTKTQPAPRVKPQVLAAPRLPLMQIASAAQSDLVPVAEPLAETEALPDALADAEQIVETEPPAVAPPAKLCLPAQGTIRYRVDRGERGFEIGRSTHSWQIRDGAYRMTAVTETTGLAALLKPLRIEWESRGRVTAAGLQPEHFAIRRNGSETNERADFDWAQMQVKIGNAAAQALSPGAQDLLSFHYQLGFLPQPETVTSLTVVTGKKSEVYPLDMLGDEEIKTPAGVFRTLHLRAPGENATELWLDYDHFMLPVKIRHTDREGDGFVELAVDIQLSPLSTD